MLRRTFLLFSFLLLAVPAAVFAEEIPERIDGTVLSVDLKSRLLRLDFEHPATFKHSQPEFYVAEDAGFKDFKKLSQLKAGDLVSIDYLDYGKTWKAIYIILIPQEKTYFTHKEVADALAKIKKKD